MPEDQRNYPTTARDSAGVRLYITRPGQAEELVEGISSLSPPPLTVDSREKTTFDSGNEKEFSPGLVDGGEVSFSAMWNPSHPGYIAIRAAHTSRETLAFRMVVPESEIIAPAANPATRGITITAAGVVTFAGTAGAAPPNWKAIDVGTGGALKVGNTLYLIRSIDENSIPTVRTVSGGLPAAVAAAAAFAVVKPQVNGAWDGFITGAPPSIETDSNITVEFSVKVTGSPTVTIGG